MLSIELLSPRSWQVEYLAADNQKLSIIMLRTMARLGGCCTRSGLRIARVSWMGEVAVLRGLMVCWEIIRFDIFLRNIFLSLFSGIDYWHMNYYIGSHLKIVAYLRHHWLLYSKISSIWHQPTRLLDDFLTWLGHLLSQQLGLHPHLKLCHHQPSLHCQKSRVFSVRIFPCFFT